MGIYIKGMDHIPDDGSVLIVKNDGLGQAYIKYMSHIGYSMRLIKVPDMEDGEWELKDHQWECNKCGCRINTENPFSGNTWNFHFCPHCGTKMTIAVQRLKGMAERRTE